MHGRIARTLLAATLAAVAAPSVAAAAPDDWGVTRDPFDLKVIGQYKGILARAPHDPTAFARLLEMYKRYRTIDVLKAEYGKVLDKSPADWAALVVSARLAHTTGDDARALELYQRATAAKASDPLAWLAIGELDKAANKSADARVAYDNALAHATTKDAREKALRSLADLALAANDIDGANAYFKQFLDLEPTNAQLWIERGDAMLAANRRDVALESYAAAEKLLGGDPSKRMEVIARRGQALEADGQDDAAIAEYRRAIKLVPKGYYLENELTGRIVDIYRKQQKLDALLAEYEKQWPEAARGHFEWSTLGKLYEETGAQDKAIAALKRAVAKSPWELETQRHLIALLENSGRDDEALAQYEVVVRAAPGEARFQLELADRYVRRGQDKKALEVMQRLEQRFPSDAGVLSAVADFYSRIGKEDLAMAEYERLAKLEPDDASHLVVLGEQYWNRNLNDDRARAMQIWKRITATGKPAAYAKLAEVLAEHNDTTGALAAYNQAIKLDDKVAEFYKGRAGVYEMMKAGQYGNALADFEKMLTLIGTKPTDRAQRREIRRRIVALLTTWTTPSGGGMRETHEQEYRRKWTTAFAAATPDVEAGYFLVEYFAKRPQANEPLTTLVKLSALVPDDQELAFDLVAALRREHRYDEAVARLLAVAKAAPSREREVYAKISEIKTEARQDDEAIAWAQKALEKSPSDPGAYERLAERYVEMQRFPDAIAAYEKTVKLDPTNAKAHFALAELYVQNNEPARAAELLRVVVRTSQQDEIVQRAGRSAIDLEEMTGTLGELEKFLSPLAFVMAHKPVYRQVLVELYGRYVPRLVEHERRGNDEVRKAARAELLRIGEHGLRPLLEALRSENEPEQQKIAVEVLGYLGNKGAAAALVHIARQDPAKATNRRMGSLTDTVDRTFVVDALVAAGRLADPSVFADVLPLTKSGEVQLREAAVFALGRSADKRAVAPLLAALADTQASVQALACIGLGAYDDPKIPPALAAIVGDGERSDTVRAACAYAIGVRRASSGESALLAALTDNRGQTQRLAAWALGMIADGKTLAPLIHAYYARTTAGGSDRGGEAMAWAIRRVAGETTDAGATPDAGGYPFRSGHFDDRAAIEALPGPLPHGLASRKLAVDHAADIAASLADALAEHRDVVVSALTDLDTPSSPQRANDIGLGALSPPAPGAKPDPNAEQKVTDALAAIGAKIAPAVAAQLSSDDPKVRALALSVIAKLERPTGSVAVDGRGSPAAGSAAGGPRGVVDAAISKALTDGSEQVRAAAMAAVVTVAFRRTQVPTALIDALAHQLATAPGWADRRAAALALGKLAPIGHAQVVAALTQGAADPAGFVREAVATALVQTAGPESTAPLAKLAADEVAQVREAAAANRTH